MGRPRKTDSAKSKQGESANNKQDALKNQNNDIQNNDDQNNSDIDILNKLAEMEAKDNEKIVKTFIDVIVPKTTAPSPKTGYQNYFDTKLNKHCVDKEEVVKQMIKYNPSRFKLV